MKIFSVPGMENYRNFMTPWQTCFVVFLHEDMELSVSQFLFGSAYGKLTNQEGTKEIVTSLNGKMMEMVLPLGWKSNGNLTFLVIFFLSI